jgi:hypothetical protein
MYRTSATPATRKIPRGGDRSAAARRGCASRFAPSVRRLRSIFYAKSDARPGERCVRSSKETVTKRMKRTRPIPFPRPVLPAFRAHRPRQHTRTSSIMLHARNLDLSDHGKAVVARSAALRSQ